MKFSWGKRPLMPRDLLDVVSSMARRLGRQVASDDLFLLALTELPGDHEARRALEDEGVVGERLLREIRTVGDGPSEREGGLTFAPAFYSMEGRAQGFAATLGDGTITPQHVLMALLWDPSSASSQLLWRLGISREKVVDRLRKFGVPVPRASLPPQQEIQVRDQVWFDRKDVRAVLDHLRLNVPPGTYWGFNYEGERAWALAETRVDLQALVDEALAH